MEPKYGQFQLRNLRELASNVISQNKFQRVIDNLKVDAIKEALLQEKVRYGLGEIVQTGIVQVGKCQGQTYIIDGQHRFKAFSELNSPTSILVQEWDFKNEEEMMYKFKEINMNTQMDGYVVSNSLSRDSKDAYNILINYVQTKYKNYIKTTLKPYFPNINLDQFRKLIHIVPYLKQSTSFTIISDFEKYNQKCYSELDGDPKETDRVQKIKREKTTLHINRDLSELWKRHGHEIN